MGQQNATAADKMPDHVRANMNRSGSLERSDLIAMDAFFEYGKAKDAINPIYAATGGGGLQSTLQSAFDFGKFLDRLSGKRLDKGKAVDVVSAEEAEEELSSDDLDEGEVGKYHRERKDLTEEDERFALLQPSKHPVVIEGDMCIGSVLRLTDISAYKAQFPVTSYEWQLSSSMMDSENYIGEGTEISGTASEDFTLAPRSFGRFVRVTATRLVEDRVGTTAVQAAARDVFDPHNRSGDPRVEKVVIRPVRSLAIAGPVLLGDDWSALLGMLLGSRDASLLASSFRRFAVGSESSARKLQRLIQDCVTDDESLGDYITEESAQVIRKFLRRNFVSCRLIISNSLTHLLFTQPPSESGGSPPIAKFLDGLAAGEQAERYGWLDRYIVNATNDMSEEDLAASEEACSTRSIAMGDLTDCATRLGKVYLGVRFASSSTPVPSIQIIPRLDEESAGDGRPREEKAAPLCLLPGEIYDDQFLLAHTEGDLILSFAIASAIQGAEYAQRRDARGRLKKFARTLPRTKEAWLSLVQDGDSSAIRRIFQVWLADKGRYLPGSIS